jgi:poly(3-hydroxybutyrate) depolymerase
MIQRIAQFLIVLYCFSINAQSVNINLRGKISNKNGQSINNAIVTLVRKNIKDTTSSDGMYSFTVNGTSVLTPIAPHTQNITLDKGILELTLSNPSLVKVEIFGIQGNLLKKIMQNASYGVYRIDISETVHASKVLIINATIGDQKWSYRYLPLNKGKYMLSTGDYIKTDDAMFAKIASVMDTVKVSANGFLTKSVAITSYNQELNISLDSITHDGKNPPGPSVGCGKSLGSLKTGTYNITSAGLNRRYIIDIPANYDPTKPYKLFFCFHWMGGSDQAVATGSIANGGAANWGYYGLKRMAENAGEQCIFVAPQGYTDGSPWRIGDNKDHIFFEDMLALFKGQFCIDTTRVFATGFSYGGMETVSQSFGHQKYLRAVCAIAGVGYNIYMPPGPPTDKIAYMHVVGTGDGLCPLNGGQERNGSWCVKTHAKNNGCTVPATLTIVASGSKVHICYDFKDCNTGYPVKLCTHTGGHVAGNVDNQDNEDGLKTWIPTETWNFFSQF